MIWSRGAALAILGGTIKRTSIGVPRTCESVSDLSLGILASATGAAAFASGSFLLVLVASAGWARGFMVPA